MDINDLGVALVIGAGTGFGGYVVAFLYELPVGASQILVGLIAVALSELALRLRKEPGA